MLGLPEALLHSSWKDSNKSDIKRNLEWWMLPNTERIYYVSGITDIILSILNH